METKTFDDHVGNRWMVRPKCSDAVRGLCAAPDAHEDAFGVEVTDEFVMLTVKVDRSLDDQVVQVKASRALVELLARYWDDHHGEPCSDFGINEVEV